MILRKAWQSTFTGNNCHTLCINNNLPLLLLLLLYFCLQFTYADDVRWEKCEDLLIGQYQCNETFDVDTQELAGCRRVHNFSSNGSAQIQCSPIKGINCTYETMNGTWVWSGNLLDETTAVFNKSKECRFTNGYHYTTALSLSLFFGWLGIDRFYLGYPAIGLLKLCTFGLCGIGALADFILIALQVVGPADNSSYVIDYYGPRLQLLKINADTFYKPPT